MRISILLATILSAVFIGQRPVNQYVEPLQTIHERINTRIKRVKTFVINDVNLEALLIDALAQYDYDGYKSKTYSLSFDGDICLLENQLPLNSFDYKFTYKKPPIGVLQISDRQVFLFVRGKSDSFKKSFIETKERSKSTFYTIGEDLFAWKLLIMEFEIKEFPYSFTFEYTSEGWVNPNSIEIPNTIDITE